MVHRSNEATWNREDRDLLIELRANMQVVQSEMAKVYLEIKDINSGLTARLLNIESNAVSKIELKETDEHVAKMEERVRTLEDKANRWLGKSDIISWTIAALLAALVAYIGR